MAIPPPLGRIAIDETLSIPASSIQWHAIRAQGAGGQHVNKTSTAVELRFIIDKGELPRAIKERLLARRDQRINRAGELVIKAQNKRSQLANKKAAIERLTTIIREAMIVAPPRVPTKPSRSSIRKRLEQKQRNSERKSMRKRPSKYET
ncbi:MAG: alternative ribosome rescue aminoacyl-tRNA hydrolase ArfB [Pseudomonadota bacterium]